MAVFKEQCQHQVILQQTTTQTYEMLILTHGNKTTKIINPLFSSVQRWSDIN